MSSICIASLRLFLGSKSYKLTLTWFNPLDDTDIDLWLIPARHDGSLCDGQTDGDWLDYAAEGMFYIYPSSGINCLWF